MPTERYVTAKSLLYGHAGREPPTALLTPTSVNEQAATATTTASGAGKIWGPGQPNIRRHFGQSPRHVEPANLPPPKKQYVIATTLALTGLSTNSAHICLIGFLLILQ